MLDVEERIKNFLNYLKENYDGKKVAIVAHKAPQLAIEVLLNGRSWQEAVDREWRLTHSWQSGWVYVIK